MFFLGFRKTKFNYIKTMKFIQKNKTTKWQIAKFGLNDVTFFFRREEKMIVLDF